MYPEIPRTAVPIWSPSAHPGAPLLATGTVSGALDASFSSDSLLELWDPFAELPENSLNPSPLASLSVASRFNRLAWGYVKSPERPRGVIAAGLENGEIVLWDPELMLNKKSAAVDPLIARYDLHKGPVRGLDFNTHQTNLLASGATNGEIYIWDLTTPNKPFSPGARSRSIDDITTLAWNAQVVHVLATGSNSGYTVVWDLKSKREVTALSYAQGAPSGVGNGFGQPGWGGGGKRGVSCIQWHPTNPTKLATASDDDQNPVIMLWDLRNWKEPEKILTGHDKGILSLSWCSQDADLLLSSGKDGRTIGWNPTSGDIVAEVTPSSNWSFDVQWCPRNPSMLTTASLDGKISIQSIQSTAAPTAQPSTDDLALAGADGAGIFDQAIQANAANYPTKSLTQHPKWLRRPSSVAFGFGGKLVSIELNPTTGQSSVTVAHVVGEPDVVDRALRLEKATEANSLADFCDERSTDPLLQSSEVASWKLLGTLFSAESKSTLVELLGFDKEDVRSKVDQAVRALKGGKQSAATGMTKTQSSGAISGLSTGSDLGNDDSTSLAREPLVTFADTLASDGLSASSDGEGAAANQRDNHVDGSEISVSASGASNATTKLASEHESEVTEPSLFGDDTTVAQGPGATQQQAAADFYSQIGSGRPAALPDHVFGRDAAANSSVAATVGSASSLASLNLKPATFKISPADESDVDRLITRALVVGDFASAVELALATDRFADAILLAVRGGPDLLAKTQRAYFERQQSNSTAALPYLRVLQSVVANDLADVVQNADLADWQAVFVVLCTFATPEEFSPLTAQLGQRLEYQYSVAKRSPTPDAAPALRKDAILCYLAASQLEKVVGIWIEQMNEDEDAIRHQAGGTGQLATSKYVARAKALQAFVEKVTVFQHAVNYVDADLANPPAATDESGVRTYKLAALYERYVEYAELLASQGLVTLALKYVAQTPADFEGLKADSTDPALTRDRLVRATGGVVPTSRFTGQQIGGSAPVASTSYAPQQHQQQQLPAQGGYKYPTSDQYANRYTGQAQTQAYPPPVTYGQQPAADNPYAPSAAYNQNDPYANPAASSYGQQQQSQYPPPVQQQQQQQPSPYMSSQPAFPNQNQYGQQQQLSQSQSFLPTPPPVRDSSPNFPPPPAPAPVGPPPKKTGWNDAPPVLAPRKVTPNQQAAAAAAAKPSAITSPFPQAQPSYGYPTAPGGVPPPPPSRGSNRTPAPNVVAPPPNRFAPPPIPTMSPPPPNGFQGRPPQQFPGPPGQQQQQHPGPPRPPQQGGPYPPAGFRGAPTPPPNAQGGQYGRPNPPPPGPYGAPAGQGQGGPPQQQRPPGPPGQQQFAAAPPAPSPYAPPPAPGPYAPPPGQGRPQGGPPPSFNNSNGQPPAPQRAQPAPAPPAPKPEPPKSKYPPGDRTHIPEASKPIFNILTNELKRVKQVTPPQQAKMMGDMEKRLNMLFDMLNCETLPEPTLGRVLEIVKAIEARNQPLALDLHLQMLTQGGSELSAFQASLKYVIQRMN
ncbi:hypothetical protein RQP46_006799 [Phenoliferia psychrophenolica]